MKDFYYYNKIGEIIERHRGPEDLMSWPRKEGMVLGVAEYGAVTSNSYVLNGELAVRPSMAVSMKNNVIYGVHAGAVVTIDETQYVADGTAIEINFAHSGAYHIQITLWPFVDWVGTYEN